MSYYNDKKNIKETTLNKTVAIATHEVGAEIIVRALNYYLGDNHTRNEAVEMMNAHAGNCLKSIAKLCKKQDMDSDEIIDYLIEIAEEFEAQALVVSMRDELKFDKPND